MSDKKQKAETAAVPKVSAPAPKAPGRFMYVGPNRLKDGLRTNQVFIGMPDALIRPLKEKYPSVGRLFIRIEDLGREMAELNKVGSPLYLAFNDLKEVK